MSEDFLLNALSKDFTVPPNTSSLQFEDAKLSAVISEVVSQTPAPTTHYAGPPPTLRRVMTKNLTMPWIHFLTVSGKDSLTQVGTNPEDKVKEKVKAEHRDKLGERDGTIPPEYRHLLDDDDEGKSATPPPKKPEASKKPADAQDPIDALSGGFDSCPSTTETSENTAKDKDKKTASGSKAPKNGDKAKDSAKAKEETSKRKADGKSTS